MVRSRYSAYSTKSIPYIIKTTSKDNPQHYLDDFEVWKSRLEEDCYDSYTLDQCDVSSTSYDPSASYVEGDEVKVTFTAYMKEKGKGGKTTSFREVSTFRREDIGGGHLGWLYQFGDID